MENLEKFWERHAARLRVHVTDTPPHACRSCGVDLAIAISTYEEPARPGDLCICSNCGLASVFNADLSARVATLAEMHAYASHSPQHYDALVRSQRSIRLRHRGPLPLRQPALSSPNGPGDGARMSHTDPIQNPKSTIQNLPIPLTTQARVSSAEICRQNGWDPGTVLDGPRLPKETCPSRRIRITAIGATSIMAVEMSRASAVPGQWYDSGEARLWNLHTRDWQQFT